VITILLKSQSFAIVAKYGIPKRFLRHAKNIKHDALVTRDYKTPKLSEQNKVSGKIFSAIPSIYNNIII